MNDEIVFESLPAAAIDAARFPREYLALMGDLLAQGLEFVLVGGLAVALAGGKRLTRDLDAIVRDRDRIVPLLYDHGFKVVNAPVPAEPGAWTAYASPESAGEYLSQTNAVSFKSIHASSGSEFDFWIGSPDERRLPLAGIFSHALPVRVADLELKRACAEDLIELKQIAMRADPSRAATDSQDIRYLQDYLRKYGPERPGGPKLVT